MRHREIGHSVLPSPQMEPETFAPLKESEPSIVYRIKKKRPQDFVLHICRIPVYWWLKCWPDKSPDPNYMPKSQLVDVIGMYTEARWVEVTSQK